MSVGDERETRLPVWARKLIADLRRRVRYGNEPLLEEVAHSRSKIELLTNRNEALKELLQCAARGGHATAIEIIQIIEQYDLVLHPKEVDGGS